MSFVYERAEAVLIWLEPYEKPKSCDFRNLLLNLHQVNQRDKQFWLPLESWLTALTDEEYWKRTWIIQGICLAQEIWDIFRGFQTIVAPICQTHAGI